MKFQNMDDLPIEETDEVEFKSGDTTKNEAKKKLAAAASGFGNTGGGAFVLGVDDQGIADGGWPKTIERQSISDWIDNIVNNVEPVPPYSHGLIDDVKSRGNIEEGNAVVVVEFGPSALAPHMAPDRKYYVRAGAHTVPARAFMVEALWAKRAFASPMLCHLIRFKSNQPTVIQLGLISTGGQPALNVKISLENCGPELQEDFGSEAMEIPVIDETNPFYFDVTFYDTARDDFPENAMIKCVFQDMTGKEYEYLNRVGMAKALPPFTLTEKTPNPFGSVDPRKVKSTS